MNRKIIGATVGTPMNPDLFGGGGSGADGYSIFYTDFEIEYSELSLSAVSVNRNLIDTKGRTIQIGDFVLSATGALSSVTSVSSGIIYLKPFMNVNGKDGAQGPQGETGPAGPQGEKGDTGPQGEKGDTGAQGSPGEKGEKGDTGATGAQGEPGKDGANGKDGTSATHSWNGTVLTVTSASGTSSADLKGAKGDKGDKGDSIKGDTGAAGADGVSPTVAVSKSGKVTTISITDKNGTKTATINDGADGSAGANGKDGTSVTHSWSGTTLTVTSASGTTSANLKGDKGDTGGTGAAGTSVTVKSVSESTADGGSNVVTFSDGKTLTIKNGSKGSSGSNGTNGTNGVSVSSVKQTTTSSADGGSNVVTVTLSNGTTSTFTVKNGSKGSAGTNGTDGKTPVKGVDYWTAADQEAIVQDVIAALGTPVFGRVDGNNNIILTGNLVEGNSYTVKYEDAEGNVMDVGSIVFEAPPTYTNRLPLAIASDGTPYNGGQGWKTDTRLNSSGAESTSSATGIEVTGFIPVKGGDELYLKDVVLNFGYDAANTYIWLYNSSFTKLNGRYIRLGDLNATLIESYVSKGLLEKDADGNWTKFVVDGDTIFKTGSTQDSFADVAYIRFSCHEITTDSIVTVNEPIV